MAGAVDLDEENDEKPKDDSLVDAEAREVSEQTTAAEVAAGGEVE